ncbi:hypothetical protein [Parasphingorhabdus pacifica]
MSRQELADAVNAWLHHHTNRAGALDAHYVARLERGAVRWPGREYRAGFRAILGVGTDSALGFLPPNRARSALRDAPGNGPSITPVPEGHVEPHEDERLSAVRGFPRRTDAAALDSLARVLAGIRKLEDETSAADVLPSVLAQRALVDRMVADARGRIRQQAVGLSSEIAQYLGWLYVPSRLWEVALRHFDRAVALALEADDPLRLATALSFQADVAMRTGDLRTAQALAEAAGRDTRVNIGLRTYLVFQRAEIVAKRGDRSEAARLLIEADRMVEALPPARELPRSGYWYTPGFFLGQRALVLRELGDVQAAKDSATASMAEMPDEWADSEWAACRRALIEA